MTRLKPNGGTKGEYHFDLINAASNRTEVFGLRAAVREGLTLGGWG